MSERRGPQTFDAAAVLAAEHVETADRCAVLKGDFDAVVAASADSNADDEHDPEGQTIAYERSQLSSLIRRARASLEEIEAATDRLAAGTYGSCAVCHQPVGAERLEAKPTARTCIRHADVRS